MSLLTCLGLGSNFQMRLNFSFFSNSIEANFETVTWDMLENTTRSNGLTKLRCADPRNVPENYSSAFDNWPLRLGR